MIKIQDYFQRIGFTGSPGADLPTLQALHHLHPARIPFENIDVLLDGTIHLTLDQIGNKLINRQRGGYCFEQNNLLMAVLREIGFTVEPLMARVVWQQPVGAPAGPKTHMVLRTEIDGMPWLVDVGFGGMVLNTPLQFITDLEQQTAHAAYRLSEHGYGYMLEVQLKDQWMPMYHLSLDPLHPIDIEVANWYTSAHPHSKFRHTLMAARTTEDTRYSLLNNRLTLRKIGADPVQTILPDTDALATALTDHFLLPVQPEWLDVLQRQIVLSN